MKTHRVRSCNPIDGTINRHWFIEIEEDRWLPVASIEINGPNIHRRIHGHLEHERVSNTISIGFATRAFNIGIIKDWQEEKPITQERFETIIK